MKEDGYRVLYFDTWKYERDSFRRQFLITLDNDLKLGLDFKNRLNQSLTETDPTLGQIKFDKRLLFNQLGIIALVIIGVGLLGLGFGLIINISDGYNFLFSVITSLGLATYTLQLAINAISRVQISFTKNKTDSAEGFEEHFAEALDKIKGQDLLVIIDNLDRLSSERAVSLLSDIKTFLSDEKYCFNGSHINNKTVFVIPCDNRAINDQLLKEYGSSFDTEEYLRKFFNHSIQIPKFLNLELDDFIIDKLNITGIEEFKDNYDLSFILSYAFRNNPREIIQFINSLISLYLLAKEREITRITEIDHIAFLAKVLVLRVKWPKLYEKIEDNVLRTGNKLNEIIPIFSGSMTAEDKMKLDDFIRATSHINDSEYQDIYFSLRQSSQQKTIPEWNSFVLSLLEGRKSDAEKIYFAVKSSNKLAELGNLLADYCRRNINNENTLLNIFLNIHTIVNADDTKYFQNVFLLTLKTVNSGILSSSIEKIDLSNLFNDGLQGVSPANRTHFSEKVVSLIKNIAGIDPMEREKFKNIRKLFEIINSDNNKDYFKNKYSELTDAKRDLIGRLKFQELFPVTEKLDEFRRDILVDVLDIMISLGPVNTKHYSVGLTLFGNLLQWSPVIENDDIRFYVLERSLEFVNKSKSPSSDDGTVGVILNTFTTRISTWYSTNKTPEEKAICVKILQKVDLTININKEPANLIKRYISEINNNADIVFDTLGNDFLVEDKNARRGLIERTKINSELIKKTSLKNNITDDEKTEIFSQLVNNAPEALSFLEYVDYKIPTERASDQNFLKNIVQTMINAGSFSDHTIQMKWFDAIKILGIKTDQVELLIQKMRQVRILSEQHKKIVSDFVLKNSKDFGDLVVSEFTE